MWEKQKENSRITFVSRAQAYHGCRLYVQGLYRFRSELDDQLLGELAELSLSPYTRVRRYVMHLHSLACCVDLCDRLAQSVMINTLVVRGICQ